MVTLSMMGREGVIRRKKEADQAGFPCESPHRECPGRATTSKPEGCWPSLH